MAPPLIATVPDEVPPPTPAVLLAIDRLAIDTVVAVPVTFSAPRIVQFEPLWAASVTAPRFAVLVKFDAEPMLATAEKLPLAAWPGRRAPMLVVPLVSVPRSKDSVEA